MIHRLVRGAALALLAAASFNASADCPATSVLPSAALPAATVGLSYSHAFSAANSNALPFVFSVSSGLPPAMGLAMVPTGTSSANLSGSPTQIGDYLVTITATDSSGCAGGRTFALNVGQGSQTISFTSTAPTTAAVAGADYSVSAVASSGLPVSYAIDASAASVCALSGTTVSFQGVGTCAVNASQPGDANYAAAASVQQSFAVARGAQTITFTSTPPASATVGGAAYTVGASASSGLAVSFSIDASASSVCAISGSSVSFLAAGTCVINADQAGNANYNAATQVQQSIAVGRTSQTIAFTSTVPAAAVFNGAVYAVAATATSGLAVGFSIDASASGVCAIAGSSVSFIGVGTCVINANQAGDSTYNAAAQIQQSFAVGKAAQTIAFTSVAPAAAVFNGATYAVTATATSGLAVGFSIDASASSVCAVAGSTVSFIGAGTCVINANQAGSATYNAAAQVQQSFTVGKADQSIAFTSTAPAAASVGGAAYTVTATATSALPVTLTVAPVASSVCTIAGSSVSFIAAGTCVINANQAGDAAYNAAPQVQQNFAVVRGAQTVTFTSTAPAAATVGGATYAVTATATSGLPVSFSIDPLASSVCSLSGSTVSFIGTGTCVIAANQAGSANYSAAAQVQQSFAVARGAQTITFTSAAPAAASVGAAAYTVTATATSGLPVSLSIDPLASAVCSLSGSTVSFIGAGTCVVAANQAGNANYDAAAQVQQSFEVARGAQTISFTSTAPAAAAVGGSAYTVTATATSGLTVSFSVDPPASSVCSLSGSTVSFIGAGTCVINANQAGSANYNAAAQAQQSFAVARGAQTISFTSMAPVAATVGGSTYTVAATATSGLAVSFSSGSATICTVTGSSVSFIAPGTCIINANQGGDANYTAATQVQQSFAVARGAQTITFTSAAPAAATVGGATYAVTATASSGLAVSFSSGSTSICTVAGNSVSFIGAGTCVINANQTGDANYTAAPQVQQSFAVARSAQTITFTSAAPVAATVGGATYTVAATASSGLGVSFSSGSAAVCTVAGSTVSFIAAGTCVVNADQSGNANYDAAAQVQQSFAVARGAQTISFTSMTPVTAAVGGATYAVTATASSGLAVSFSSGSISICTVTGNSVSFVGSGTCVINADQSGDANYTAAAQVQQSFAVARGAQTIAFTSTAPVAASVGGPAYTVAATATSGLPVSFSIDPAASGVCTLSGNTVSFIGAGTCVIVANQSGDANYNAAAAVQQSFTVALAAQTITFTSTPPAAATIGGATYTVAATASSGLPVSFSIDPAAATVCSLAGSDVSFIGGGICVINADQGGDAAFAPAPQVQQSFSISRIGQTITFTSTAPAQAHDGGSYTVSATASSGLQVSFSIDATAAAVCTVSADVVTFIGAGTCVINADQAGDASYEPAPQQQQSFSVMPCITLNVGEVVNGALPATAPLCVTNATGAAAEYTFLPINLATAGDTSLSMTINGSQAVTGPPTPRPAASPLAPLADPLQEAGHAADVVPAFPHGREIRRSDLVTPRATRAAPTLGQILDINASVGGCGVTPDIRKGRVRAITPAQLGRPAIYMLMEVREDPVNPGTYIDAVVGGFSTGDFEGIANGIALDPPGSTPNYGAGGFDYTGILGMSVTTFGAPTDLDNNGGILVFYTAAINSLSPPASSVVNAGVFQQRDLLGASSCAGSNEGEIIYMMVPDPTGVINSNVRTVSFAAGNAMPVLGHQLQHLTNASRRLYVSGAGQFEEAWLDEALSWQMHELMFYHRSFGLAPRQNIQLSTLTTGPNASRRVAAFNTYQNSIFGNDRAYFYQLSSTNGIKRFGPLRANQHSAGSLPVSHDQVAGNFSIVGSFLRYALDRRNGSDESAYQTLIDSTLSGRANLQNALGGIDLNEWLRDFLVAAYADDAGISGLDAKYTTPSWNYRSVYGGLGGFPLTVDQPTSGSSSNYLLGPGGGTRYVRFGVAAGESALLQLAPTGASTLNSVTTAIVRTK